MRNCANCGNDITNRSPQARFCADATCQRERGRAQGRESWTRVGESVRASRRAKYATAVAARPKVERICAHCGNVITGRAGRAKWCSSACRENARNLADPTHGWNQYARRVQKLHGVADPKGLSRKAWAIVIERHAGKCAYCGCTDVTLEPDHAIPLSRGGTHSVENLVMACASCNRSKRDNTPAEWMPELSV